MFICIIFPNKLIDLAIASTNFALFRRSIKSISVSMSFMNLMLSFTFHSSLPLENTCNPLILGFLCYDLLSSQSLAGRSYLAWYIFRFLFHMCVQIEELLQSWLDSRAVNFLPTGIKRLTELHWILMKSESDNNINWNKLDWFDWIWTRMDLTELNVF